MRRTMKVIPIVLAGLLVAPTTAGAAQGNDQGYKSGQATKSARKQDKAAQKITQAEQVLKAAASSSDQGIPKNLLEKAQCVGVFPGFKKVALGVGGEEGSGVFTCRAGKGMSSPAFYKLAGGSVGWQAGMEQADLVLLVMNEDAMNKILADKAKLGTDLTIAAGPVGSAASKSASGASSGTSSGATGDAVSNAQVLAYSRTHGAFAGASLTGLTLSQDRDQNTVLYERMLDARDILSADTQALPVPQIAQSFVKTTEQVM